MSLADVSRIFIILGLSFLVIGGIIFLISRFGVIPWKLPGDIRIERENFTCVLALGTSLILSLLLTLALNLIIRFFNR
jgi:hypothetical protein